LTPSHHAAAGLHELLRTPLFWVALALAVAPAFVKRALFIGEPDYVAWLIADYVGRALSLMGMFIAWRVRLLPPIGNGAGMLRSSLVFFATVLLVFAEELFVAPPLREAFHDSKLMFLYPRPHALILPDLVLGLFFVALSEELVYRRWLLPLIAALAGGRFAAVLLSNIVFALVHVTSGYDEAMTAFFDGCIFSVAFLATRRLSICVAAHYLIDVYIIGGGYVSTGAL